MAGRITIGKRGATYYNQCFDCGTPKTTRDQRRAMFCASCSGKQNKLADTDTPTKTCKVCEEVFENTNQNFHWVSKKHARLDRTCKACKSIKNKKWREDNMDRHAQNCKDYKEKNREQINERRSVYRANRRSNDVHYRLKTNISKSVHKALTSQQGGKGGQSTFTHLPYTPKQLREHLESQFEDWMTWDNWGIATHERRTWNIDHITPQSLLPYESLEHENFHRCWALENLQPLETFENIKKSNNFSMDKK